MFSPAGSTLSTPGRLRTSVRQHDGIIEAFALKDESKVETLVRENAELSAEILVKELSAERSAGGSDNYA